jgi:hypothetical protein
MTENQIVELVKQILQPPVLLAVAGAVLSLCAFYIPKFKEWYAALSTVQKSLSMFITITGLCVLVGVSSWTGFIVIVDPNKGGIIVLLFSWISALVSNQTTYTFVNKLVKDLPAPSTPTIDKPKG